MSDLIKFACGNCGASLKAPEAKAGRKLPCPKCQSPVTVPDLLSDIAVDEDGPPPVPVKSQPGSTGIPAGKIALFGCLGAIGLFFMLFIGSAVLVGVGNAVGANAGGITLEKYNQIQSGMSYEDVVSIIGEEGEEMSRTDFGGITTVLYMWHDSGLGNANVTFQQGEVVGKAQFGL